MKKPHSLYLSMLAHNRLSTYVANALDGTGSLAGFFAYIEDRTLAMLRRTDHVSWNHRANNTFVELSRLDERQVRHPLDAYRRTWDEFTAALPWFTENPAGAHILGMQPLTEIPSLWSSEYGLRDRPRHHLHTYGTSIAGALDAIRSPYVEPTIALGKRDASWRRARPILGRDRIDFITADQQVPVSVYLDTEAHETFYKAFQNRFFTRLEHALVSLLEEPGAAVDIESGAVFLELGPEGIDLDAVALAARQIAGMVVCDKSNRPRAKWWELTDAQLMSYAKEAGFDSLHDPVLLREGLDFLYLRRRDIDRTIGYDIWHITPDVSEGALATLNFANRLGLLDSADVRLLPQRISSALLERYGITHIAPTRDNAFRLIAANASGKDDTDLSVTKFDNAVDMHMWALFTLYARDCLGHGADDLRFGHRTLATLAEGDLFPRVGTIEAFTGSTAEKTPGGMWKLQRGRKTHHELDHPTFLAVSEALRGLVVLRDPITVLGDEDDDFEVGDETPAPKPYSYQVSPTVVDTVLQILSTHDHTEVRPAIEAELRQEAPRQKRTRGSSMAPKDPS